MMGRQDKQLRMVVFDLSSMIPKDHLLRAIKENIDFNFIYEAVSDRYSPIGRPSIDPTLLIKMLLIGFIYGIKSERRLEEEVHLNLAYRWFCDLDLEDRVPDHSTFSQNRRRRFCDGQVFEDIWVGVLKQILAMGLIQGDVIACDGTYIPANVSGKNLIEQDTLIRKGMHSYLDALDEELSQEPGYEQHEQKEEVKRGRRSIADPDADWIRHGNKTGLGYLMQTSCDCTNGMITGVDVFPANQKESSIVLRHLEKQIQTGVPIRTVVTDKGYDIGAVHRGLELLGIDGWIPSVEYSNTAEKGGMVYHAETDSFECPNGSVLEYHHLISQKSTGKYLRCYRADIKVCDDCPIRSNCLPRAVRRRQVVASGYFPAFHRGRTKVQESPEVMRHLLKLRAIWIEGRFSVLKREHKLGRIQKRGLIKAKEECLMACIAHNLKKMAHLLSKHTTNDSIFSQLVFKTPLFTFKGSQYSSCPA